MTELWMALGLIVLVMIAVTSLLLYRSRKNRPLVLDPQPVHVDAALRAFSKDTLLSFQAEMDAIDRAPKYKAEVHEDHAIKVTFPDDVSREPVLAPLHMLHQAMKQQPSHAEQMRQDFLDGLLELVVEGQ